MSASPHPRRRSDFRESDDATNTNTQKPPKKRARTTLDNTADDDYQMYKYDASTYNPSPRASRASSSRADIVPPYSDEDQEKCQNLCINCKKTTKPVCKYIILRYMHHTFSAVPEAEKQVYAGTMKQTGSYQGYKLRQYWHIDNGVRDQLEHYNINRDTTKRTHPEAVRPFLPEISAFARHMHFDVLHPVLRLLALGLGLPEDELVNLHNFDGVGETYVRPPIPLCISLRLLTNLPPTVATPRTPAEESATHNVWLKGHTDFGTITILCSQPVAALQILTPGPDGKWRWVRHVENALVINAGDAMEFLSGGVYKATIHRVVQPPPDQHHLTRLGVFYFCMTDDFVRLAPLQVSPSFLLHNGDEQRFADAEAPTMEAWRKARTSAYGTTQLTRKASADADGEGRSVEEEVIGGVVVKHYN
ncbi:Flavonol synthase/flavanone 3-hydroxylase [Mycena kentingensis (nom. inval.)]|nr:Flavonol synthase/flavanone 3-hydroxylase [Mycena kentingensis (nom. inval.)]